MHCVPPNSPNSGSISCTWINTTVPTSLSSVHPWIWSVRFRTAAFHRKQQKLSFSISSWVIRQISESNFHNKGRKEKKVKNLAPDFKSDFSWMQKYVTKSLVSHLINRAWVSQAPAVSMLILWDFHLGLEQHSFVILQGPRACSSAYPLRNKTNILPSTLIECAALIPSTRLSTL